jgi:thiamine-phosphate diphosphorylase
MKRVPRLHAVTTREILERPGFPRAASAVLARGEVALHLRAFGSSGRLLLELAREVLGAAPGARLLVNDRVDVARAAGTGAHLPAAGLTPVQARTILGMDPLLGRSVHAPPASGGEEEEGRDDPRLLDYVFYGHVFETSSKPGLPPRGTDGLERTARGLASRGLPVIAIGGVTPERVPEVLEAGAYGVAAISGIWETPDPAAAAARYLEHLGARAG